jgi:hypothetical protein
VSTSRREDRDRADERQMAPPARNCVVSPRHACGHRIRPSQQEQSNPSSQAAP